MGTASADWQHRGNRVSKDWKGIVIAKVFAGGACGLSGPAVVTYMSEIAVCPAVPSDFSACFQCLLLLVNSPARSVCKFSTRPSPTSTFMPFYSEFVYFGLFGLAVLYLPESPRECPHALKSHVTDWKAWLLLRGRHEKAKRMLGRLSARYCGNPYIWGYTTYFFQLAGVADPFLARPIINCINVGTIIGSFYLSIASVDGTGSVGLRGHGPLQLCHWRADWPCRDHFPRASRQEYRPRSGHPICLWHHLCESHASTSDASKLIWRQTYTTPYMLSDQHADGASRLVSSLEASVCSTGSRPTFCIPRPRTAPMPSWDELYERGVPPVTLGIQRQPSRPKVRARSARRKPGNMYLPRTPHAFISRCFSMAHPSLNTPHRLETCSRALHNSQSEATTTRRTVEIDHGGAVEWLADEGQVEEWLGPEQLASHDNFANDIGAVTIDADLGDTGCWSAYGRVRQYQNRMQPQMEVDHDVPLTCLIVQGEIRQSARTRAWCTHFR
ncbi:hypothetical protein VNO80_33224 [Phaseolus coccineus]|uniref:Uncharacterized protein n=1 Tax=Phaseolus coccineus TaxID=3886 RepID=A0AAN9Q945_PHACN